LYYKWVGVLIAFPLFVVAIDSCKEAYQVRGDSENYKVNFGRFLVHIYTYVIGGWINEFPFHAYVSFIDVH
jgi:hypothetical protein